MDKNAWKNHPCHQVQTKNVGILSPRDPVNGERKRGKRERESCQTLHSRRPFRNKHKGCRTSGEEHLKSKQKNCCVYTERKREKPWVHEL